jgi:putative SOS response-associated peptidase YedK
MGTPSTSKRCLVLADGFYEWKWLDPKGKSKQKYLLTLPDNKAFAFAGLWNTWTNRNTGETLNTYTIITTAANELMSEIHNTKKRMPVILNPEAEKNWLDGGEFVMQNDLIQAVPLE